MYTLQSLQFHIHLSSRNQFRVSIAASVELRIKAMQSSARNAGDKSVNLCLHHSEVLDSASSAAKNWCKEKVFAENAEP